MAGRDTPLWPLLPYQARWVADRSQVKIAEKSRRIGLSWAEAYDAVLHAATGRGDVAYTSFSKDMTAGWIGDCADHARALQRAASAIEESVIEDDDRSITTFTLRFPSGNKIEALSSAPRQLRSRGRPGDRIIIDEAAFVDNIDALLKAAMAYLNWGGQVHILSTHNGAGNPFAEIVEDVREGRLPYSLHRITLADAIADGLHQRIVDVQRAAGQVVAPSTPETRREWEHEIRARYRYDWMAAEELDCVPAAGGGAWIDLESYLGCEHPEAGRPERYGHGPAYGGYDVARRRDLAVQCILERRAGVGWLREMVSYERRPFSEQYAGVDRLVAAYHVRRFHIDQTGMGEAVVEELQRRHGAYRMKGVLLVATKRLELATALREAFETRALRIPAGDRVLRDDVRSMRRAPTSDGAPRLVSEGKDTDGHADRFWALALAWHGLDAGDVTFDVHRAPLHGPHAGPVRSRSGSRFRALAGGAL